MTGKLIVRKFLSNSETEELMRMSESLWEEANDETSDPEGRRIAERWAILINKIIHGKTVAGVTRAPVVVLTEEENDASSS